VSPQRLVERGARRREAVQEVAPQQLGRFATPAVGERKAIDEVEQSLEVGFRDGGQAAHGPVRRDRDWTAAQCARRSCDHERRRRPSQLGVLPACGGMFEGGESERRETVVRKKQAQEMDEVGGAVHDGRGGDQQEIGIFHVSGEAVVPPSAGIPEAMGLVHDDQARRWDAAATTQGLGGRGRDAHTEVQGGAPPLRGDGRRRHHTRFPIAPRHRQRHVGLAEADRIGE
jgi:hypothetical protein